MLNYNSPIMDIKEYSEIKISEIEPILKINLRGKNRDFITKIGKELSIITPVDPNTSSSNEKLNLLWLSPDEWFLYSNDKIDLKDADALFVSCTALPVLPIIDKLEKKLNKPVLSSNQTLIWDSIRSVGYKPSIEGYGKLLRN